MQRLDGIWRYLVQSAVSGVRHRVRHAGWPEAAEPAGPQSWPGSRWRGGTAGWPAAAHLQPHMKLVVKGKHHTATRAICKVKVKIDRQ